MCLVAVICYNRSVTNMSLDFMLSTASLLGGIAMGFCLWFSWTEPWGVVVAVVGGLACGATGLGIALLHRRVVLRIARPDKWPVDGNVPGVLAEIYREAALYPIVLSLFTSYVGTMTLFACLVRFVLGWPASSSKSFGECMAMFSSMAIGGFLLLWATRKLGDWVASRCRSPGKEDQK
jgi:hypothetical protein